MRKILLLTIFILAMLCSAASAIYIDNGDGTVTDTETGLMWKQTTESSTMNWQSAIDHCDALSFAGYDDWRLPEIDELASLIEGGSAPYIDTNMFPDTASSGYWSSTTDDSNTYSAWYVYFGNGNVFSSSKSNSYYVRAVRGGQSGSFDNLVISAPQHANHWGIGSTVNIIWDPGDHVGDVQITLSRQYGKEGTFETVVENTPNDGSYTWTVTGPESIGNCYLKIENPGNPDEYRSVGFFSIDTVFGVYCTVNKDTNPDTFILTLNGIFADGIFPVETQWTISDENIATVTDNTLTANQNGYVGISADYIGEVYTKEIFVHTTHEAMEMEPNNVKASGSSMNESIFYTADLYSGDVDYYQFTLSSDTFVDLGYLSYSASADMLIELFDAGDTLLASATSTNGESAILSTGLAAGTYYVKASSAGDIDQSSYYVMTYKTGDPLPAKPTETINLGESKQAGFIISRISRNIMSISPRNAALNFYSHLRENLQHGTLSFWIPSRQL